MERSGESDASEEPQMARREELHHDGLVNHAGLGSRIPGANSDLDILIYGRLILSAVVAQSGGFETRKDNGLVYAGSKVAG